MAGASHGKFGNDRLTLYTDRYNHCCMSDGGPSNTDNRNHILERALDLFARRGYDAVGVQEIAVAAQVTKPTLYHYFESKHGLLTAIVAVHGSPLRSAVRQAALYQQDLVMNLERVAFALVEQAKAQPVFYRLLLALYFAPPECEARAVAMDLLLDLQQCLEELFSAAVPQHGNMRGRQGAYAATYLGMLNTWIGIYLNDLSALDPPAIRAALKQYQHGIFS